ncbi:polymorphic toxin type 50 domain-containing protein [Gilliamella sp. Pra-s60]
MIRKEKPLFQQLISLFTIHYSKTGVHIVPARPSL